ncbi:MAG TPA: lipid II flippase MurJ, partial [Myxococcaceae bacterium]|nr:lipid II flippase MurJ [Myxococcaceae bacterium]
MLVASGILASRLFGLVRERVFAHYFGSSVAAAAFKAALRIPNFLQNLFGEGVLSASFIPVYSQLLGEGDSAEARRVAGSVFGILSLATSLLVALGVWLTPVFIDLIAPGFAGEGRALAIVLVRILFPMTGLLVLSAWCLGVLNSHGHFFLSYAAPVIWNGAMIAA